MSYVNADTIPGHALSGSGNKMIPAGLSGVTNTGSVTPYSYAVCPAKGIIVERPEYVILHNTGSFSFAYNLTGSIGTDASGADLANHYITGSMIQSGSESVRLDINPVAWQACDHVGTTGEITFVYRGR